MRLATLCLTGFALLLAGNGPVLAQDGADSTAQRLEELERRLQDAEATIQSQQSELESLRSGETVDPAQVDESVDRYLDAMVAEGKMMSDFSDFSLAGWWKDGFKWKSRNGDHRIQLGGRVQFDGRFSVGEGEPLVSTFDTRRARIDVRGTLFQYYDFLLQTDFQSGTGTLLDAWINFHYIDEAQLLVGQDKQPFGLEQLTNDAWVKPIENSIATNFITPSRDTGAMIHGTLADDRVGYQIAYFNGNGSNATDNNDEKDLGIRLTLDPFKNHDNMWLKGIHLGGAMTWGQPELTLAGTGPTTAVGTQIFTYNAGVISEEERTRWGFEGAWHVGPFGLSAEFMELLEDLGNPQSAGNNDGRGRIWGWYATANYFITGEDTSFGRVYPNDPFDPMGDSKGWGAFELFTRVGQLGTNEDTENFITGADRALQVMTGVNWYLNSAVRVSLNYQYTDFGDLVGGERDEDSILFRMQIMF